MPRKAHLPRATAAATATATSTATPVKCLSCFPPPPCDSCGPDMNVNGASFSSSDGVGDDIMTNNATTNGPAPIAVYLYAGDQIIENVTTGYLYFQDSLGNTSHVTDSTGNLKESYTYSAFGTPYFYYPNDPTHNPRNTSAFGIRHLFQGQL